MSCWYYNTCMAIRILPPEIASQIAAGEVIERPASVVKELIENALDAGARQITVKTEGAGQHLIEIADDGGGISAEELPLAVERHATSKLSNATDLFHITTLGFRGEALASIGSVSRLTITSRRADADLGASLHVEGGRVVTVQPAGSPAGTLVRVEDLFYNLPARLKFLKHPTTERRHIDALVTRYALAYPQVRFQLMQEGNIALHTSGNGEQREVLAALYGPDVARQMLAVLYSDSELDLHGFISPLNLTRSNRREMLFFVNGRPVQDASLSAAILKGYHTFLMVGRYPMVMVFITIPPDKVDVNVHPTKAEVRFRDSDRIFSSIQNGIRRALMAHNPVPILDQQLRWQPGFPHKEIGRQIDPAWRWDQEERVPSVTSGEPSGNQIPAQAPLTTNQVPLLRLVGQIANTYLVAEAPDGLYLIDQHAAHERVLFERFMTQRRGSFVSQTLLQAATVELSAASARLLSSHLGVLSSIGFQVEVFGPNTFLVRAIPSLLVNIDPAAALSVLVEDFEEDETPLQTETEARLIARICKRAAVKAGKSLSAEEQQALLLDLETCSSPRTCPHGRPTMIHLSVDLLERQFGRRGAR